MQSIPAKDILAACDRMLRKQLYVVLTKPTRDLAPIMEVLDEHLQFQIDLERRGIMFGAGPFWTDDEQSWEGDGMVIIRSLARCRKPGRLLPPTQCTRVARAHSQCGHGS
jgi:hypothetical protein